MVVRRKRIQQIALELLEKNGVLQPPVPVERIAKTLDLVILKQRLVPKQKTEASEISGFLFSQGGKVVIGVNASQPTARQRFTIAHELGHFLLHNMTQKKDEIHVDRSFELRFRDDRSRQGTDVDEREANLFAAELLMPRHFLTKDLSELNEVDWINDDFTKELADRYGTSSQAMLFRLANLGYVRL